MFLSTMDIIVSLLSWSTRGSTNCYP